MLKKQTLGLRTVVLEVSPALIAGYVVTVYSRISGHIITRRFCNDIASAECVYSDLVASAADMLRWEDQSLLSGYAVDYLSV